LTASLVANNPVENVNATHTFRGAITSFDESRITVGTQEISLPQSAAFLALYVRASGEHGAAAGNPGAWSNDNVQVGYALRGMPNTRARDDLVADGYAVVTTDQARNAIAVTIIAFGMAGRNANRDSWNDAPTWIGTFSEAEESVVEADPVVYSQLDLMARTFAHTIGDSATADGSEWFIEPGLRNGRPDPSQTLSAATARARLMAAVDSAASLRSIDMDAAITHLENAIADFEAAISWTVTGVIARTVVTTPDRNFVSTAPNADITRLRTTVKLPAGLTWNAERISDLEDYFASRLLEPASRAGAVGIVITSGNARQITVTIDNVVNEVAEKLMTRAEFNTWVSSNNSQMTIANGYINGISADVIIPVNWATLPTS
jgi:hypothetical protein